MRPDGSNDRLKLVFAFAIHADFASLDLRGDFEFPIPHEGSYLFGNL